MKHFFSTILLWPAAGFTAGIAAVSFGWPVFGSGLLLFFLILFPIIFRSGQRYRILAAVILCVSFLAAFSYYRHFVSVHERYGFWLDYYGKKVTVYGRVSVETETTFPSVSFDLEMSSICLDGRCQKAEEKIRVSAPAYPSFSCGDRLRLEGKLERPEPSASFRYDRYLARFDIYAQLYYPEVQLVGQEKDCPLASFRQGAKAIIYHYMPEPEGGLSAALLLGYRHSLGEDREEDFSRSGLSHLIAISGTHITLLSGLIISCLEALRIGKRKALFLAWSFIWVYVAMSGFQSSALRAAIMGALAVWFLSGRNKDGFSAALFVAAALMLLGNPLLLRDDLGFQMSFLAMVALGYIFPHFEGIYSHRVRRPWLKAAMDNGAMSLAAFLLIWPVSLQAFGQVAAIGIVSNIFVGPMFNIFLPLSLLSTVIAWVLPGLGLLSFYPTYLLARIALAGAAAFANLPGAVWEGGRLSGYIIILYYCVCFLAAVCLSRGRDRRRK